MATSGALERTTAVRENILHKAIQLHKWLGQRSIEQRNFLGGSSLDRIYKCVAWKAVVCHLHTFSQSTERFLRCCKTPFRSRAQGYLRERKSFSKCLWQLKFCWWQSSLVEGITLDKQLYTMVLSYLSHVLPTWCLYRHLAEARNKHDSEGNFYAKQSSKPSLKKYSHKQH